MQSNKRPIFITGVERSGSTLVARSLQSCNVFAGSVNVMRENLLLKTLTRRFIIDNANDCFMPDFRTIEIPVNWKNKVDSLLKKDGYKNDVSFMYKDSGLAQTWKVWNYAYPNAKWIIVRRRTGDIIHSCIETAYMKRFKNKNNMRLVGAESERDGWLWWIKQYELRFIEMLSAELDCRIVWPERMKDGDFEQLKETIEWAGLEWNEDIIITMNNLFKK